MLTGTQQHLADVLGYYGMGLQLAGVLAAAIGISEVRREWTNNLGIAATTLRATSRAVNRIRTIAATVIWRARSRWGHPKPKIVNLHAVGSQIDLRWSVDVTLTVGPAPVGGTLEERVQWLEQTVTSAFDHAEDTRQRLLSETGARRQALTAEQAAREAHVEQVRQSIGRLAGGGLRLQAIGVGYLLFGIVLATIPDKLAAIG